VRQREAQKHDELGIAYITSSVMGRGVGVGAQVAKMRLIIIVARRRQAEEGDDYG
jgi:hypothetical protein